MGPRVFIFFLMLNISSIALSGNEAGGGHGVVIRNASGTIESVRLLDIFEATEQYELQVPEKVISVKKQLRSQIKRLKLVDPDYFGSLKKLVDHLLSEAKLVESGEIQFIDDALPTLEPSQGRIEQLANYFYKDGKILIARDIWNKLPLTHRTGLYLHEAVYKILREREGVSDSRKARMIVAYTLSDMSDEVFSKFYKKNIKPKSFPYSGYLDLDFGNRGVKLIKDFKVSSANSVLVQKDGTILAAGYIVPKSVGVAAVAKFKKNGALDRNFNPKGPYPGFVVLPMGGSSAVQEMVVDKKNRILVAGQAYTENNWDFSLIRLHANGELDLSFANSGVLNIDFNGGGDKAKAVAIDKKGRILLAGSAQRGPTKGLGIAVARVLSEGKLDESFNGTGKVMLDIKKSHNAIATSLGVWNNRILVSGRIILDKQADLVIARYREDGILDPTFAVDSEHTGVRITDISESNDIPWDLRVGKDGKVTVAGEAFNGKTRNFAMVRYDVDGNLDWGFGTMGMVVTFEPSETYVAKSMAIQDDNKLIVVGHRSNGKDWDVALNRYLSDGCLDPTFGHKGKVTTKVKVDFNEVGYGVALQKDRKILVAGNIAGGWKKMMLLRYLP